MKYEDEKLVIFGIFSPSIKPKKIIDSFIQIAKHFFKTSKPQNPVSDWEESAQCLCQIIQI